MMAAALHADRGGQDAARDSGSATRASPFAAAQRAAISAAPSPRASASNNIFGGLMMAKIRMRSKRLKMGLPRRDIDSKGKPMNRILKLNEVIALCGKSDDVMWKAKSNMKKRYAMIQNEYRKAVTALADDVRFLVRCFELLDEDESDEISIEQLLRWVTLLGDPSGDGQGGDGDGQLRKDLLAKMEKQDKPSTRFDWQDFVVVNVDFYVLAGAAAMRRTYGELLESEGKVKEGDDGLEMEGLSLEPTPPMAPKKKASLADDVRERRAARAAKLGTQLGIEETPPTAGNAEATVGSGGGRPGPGGPSGGDIESLADDDQEVAFSGSEGTVNLDEEKGSSDPAGDEEEMRLAETVVPE